MADAHEELRRHTVQRPIRNQYGKRGGLQVAFTFSTGVDRGHESAPIVVGDTLCFVTPYPNILYALELGRPGAPLR